MFFKMSKSHQLLVESFLIHFIQSDHSSMNAILPKLRDFQIFRFLDFISYKINHQNKISQLRTVGINTRRISLIKVFRKALNKKLVIESSTKYEFKSLHTLRTYSW